MGRCRRARRTRRGLLIYNRAARKTGLEMRLLIITLTILLLCGCTGMLLGADVTPAEQTDTEEDEESEKDK